MSNADVNAARSIMYTSRKGNKEILAQQLGRSILLHLTEHKCTVQSEEGLIVSQVYWDHAIDATRSGGPGFPCWYTISQSRANLGRTYCKPSQPLIDASVLITLILFWSMIELVLALLALCFPVMHSLVRKISLESVINSFRSMTSLASGTRR